MRLSRPVAAASVCVLALLSQGCSSASSGDSVDVDGDTSTLALPLWSYISTRGRVQAELDDAITRAQIDCMRDRGFRFDPEVGIESGAAVDVRRRYGVFDSASASSLGYLASPPSTSEEKTPEDIGFPSDPEALAAYELALFGQSAGQESVTVPGSGTTQQIELNGGCIAQASSAVFGSRERWAEFVALVQALSELDTGSFTAFSTSSVFAEASADWNQCMQGKGIDGLATPFDAMNFEWPEPRPTRREIDVAKADVACKLAAGFIERAVEFETQWQAGHPEIETLVLAFDEISQSLVQS